MSNRKPNFSEPTHGVQLSVTPVISWEIGERATELGLSKKLFGCFLAMQGLNQVFARLGEEPLVMPPVFRPAQRQLDYELMSRPLPVQTEAAPDRVMCWMPVSAYDRAAALAERLGVPAAGLCSWAAITWLNALRVVGGQLPYDMPRAVRRHEEKILGVTPPAQSALPAEVEEEALLAS